MSIIQIDEGCNERLRHVRAPHRGTLKNQPIDKPKRPQIQLVSFED